MTEQRLPAIDPRAEIEVELTRSGAFQSDDNDPLHWATPADPLEWPLDEDGLRLRPVSVVDALATAIEWWVTNGRDIGELRPGDTITVRIT